MDLFSKVGLASLSDAAATVLQENFHALRKGRQCREAFRCAREMLGVVVSKAAEELGRRSEAAPQIQKHFRGYLVRQSGVLELKRKAFYGKQMQEIEIVQSFMHRFAEQARLREEIRESRIFDAASRIQARARGILARKHVARLAEEAEWPLKGWFEYTGMGRDCVQISVKFLLNPGFDAFRHFRRYGKQQTLLERLQEMQKEIDSCLRSYLGPAEYAAMEARKAAGLAAQRAKAEAEREQEELLWMQMAEKDTWAIEKMVRAEEAELRKLEEERLRAEEEARLAEEEAKNIEDVSLALAKFTDAALALLQDEAWPNPVLNDIADQTGFRSGPAWFDACHAPMARCRPCFLACRGRPDMSPDSTLAS